MLSVSGVGTYYFIPGIEIDKRVSTRLDFVIFCLFEPSLEENIKKNIIFKSLILISFLVGL